MFIYFVCERNNNDNSTNQKHYEPEKSQGFLQNITTSSEVLQVSDIGSVAATGVTTIGTIATVGIAAKVAQSAMKNAGKLPKTKSNYRVLKGSRPRNSRRKSNNFSIWK